MKTHAEIIRLMVARTAGSGDSWATRHYAAWVTGRGGYWPRVDVSPIPRLVDSLAAYADAYNRRYGARLGEDRILGKHWLNAVESVRGMLNGDCGALDCGTVDAVLCSMLSLEGIDPEQLQLGSFTAEGGE
jgi:hypothetical protein